MSVIVSAAAVLYKSEHEAECDFYLSCSPETTRESMQLFERKVEVQRLAFNSKGSVLPFLHLSVHKELLARHQSFFEAIFVITSQNKFVNDNF